MSITVSLDTTLYPSQCVREATDTFSKLCVLDVRVCPVSIVAEFSIGDGEEMIVDEFLNYVLTRSIEDYLTRTPVKTANLSQLTRISNEHK
jgi:hypothetical protein